MESFNNLFFNFNVRNNDVCCEILLKIRQFTNMFQMELSRLGNLQLESNQLLDQFYASKNEFDFISKDALEVKYFGEDASKSIEYVEEVSTFLNTVWHMGKVRFSDKSRRSQYTCFLGAGITEVTTRIRNFVDEIMSQIYYQPYHSECAAAICAHSSQIYTILQGESLPSADLCFRQYIYLTHANPFLQQLNLLIHQYLVHTDVATVKQFIDTIMFDNPSISVDTSGTDSAEMAPFRYVVDLLNGTLLDEDFLDHRSDIRPVVEEDINLKKSLQAKATVQWIMQQYSVPDVNQLWLQSGSQMLADFTQRNNALFAEFYSVQRSKSFTGPVRGSQRKTSSPRGRRRQVNQQQRSSAQDDLQPIVLHALQSPILKPLF